MDPTNATVTHTATGIDGASNSASYVTATAGNATICQTITTASQATIGSAYVERLTGTGEIDFAIDGSTWTRLDCGAGTGFTDWLSGTCNSSSWVRSKLSAPQTLSSLNVCFRIVTNGDAIAVDGVQTELSQTASEPTPTSVLLTTSTSTVRATETVTYKGIPYNTLNGNQRGAVIFEAQNGAGIGSAENLFTSNSDSFLVLATGGHPYSFASLYTGGGLQDNSYSVTTGGTYRIISAWDKSGRSLITSTATLKDNHPLGISNSVLYLARNTLTWVKAISLYSNRPSNIYLRQRINVGGPL